jgi:hypothetical protein
MAGTLQSAHSFRDRLCAHEDAESAELSIPVAVTRAKRPVYSLPPVQSDSSPALKAVVKYSQTKAKSDFPELGPNKKWKGATYVYDIYFTKY